MNLFQNGLRMAGVMTSLCFKVVVWIMLIYIATHCSLTEFI